MELYKVHQQAKIFNGCKTATELLTAREIIEEIQFVSGVAMMVYNFKMSSLSSENKI